MERACVPGQKRPGRRRADEDRLASLVRRLRHEPAGADRGPARAPAELAARPASGISITRVVGKRVISTILAEYTLLNPGGNDARFEAVLRSSSRRTFTPLSISTWSSLRATITWSSSRSPRRPGTAARPCSRSAHPAPRKPRAEDRGRTYGQPWPIRACKVVDRFLAPVVGAPIALERKQGGGWVRVARAKTSERASTS